MFYLDWGWQKSVANKSISAIPRLQSVNKQLWKETILKETFTLTYHIMLRLSDALLVKLKFDYGT